MNQQFDSLMQMPQGRMKKGYHFAGKGKPAASQQHRKNPSLTTEGSNQLSPAMSSEMPVNNPDEKGATGAVRSGGSGPALAAHQVKTGAEHPNRSTKVGGGGADMNNADEMSVARERNLGGGGGPALKNDQSVRTGAARSSVAQHMSGMKVYPGSPLHHPPAGSGKADMHMPDEAHVVVQQNLNRSDNTSKMHGASPGRYQMDEHHNSPRHAGEQKWIKKAIKHPGRMKRAAARAGMSTHAYMQKHEHSPGSLGSAARLGLKLSAMNKG